MDVRSWEGEGTMALWAKRWKSAGRRLAVVALLAALGLTGCGKESVPAEAEKSPEGTPTVADNNGTKTGTPANSDNALPPPPKDGQHEPFAKATRGGDDPPPNSN